MSKKILIVDDEMDVSSTVKSAFVDLDYDIETFENGEKFFEILEKNSLKPDLIILDIMMPGMSGWDVFKKLKENQTWSNIPVVFLTARKDSNAENAGKFLADDFIEKPFDPTDLKKRVVDILEK